MSLRSGAPLPDLSGATEWINGEVKREELIGCTTLIHFFAISCPICHDNMSTISLWRDNYFSSGLRVVGIHMPREQEDTVMERVRAEIATMGITEHCAIDNRHTIGERFENQLWPAYYLFDSEGLMRGRAGGYAGLKMIHPVIKRILGVTEDNL